MRARRREPGEPGADDDHVGVVLAEGLGAARQRGERGARGGSADERGDG